MTFLQDIWKFRYLLFNLTAKELKVKYKHSILGSFWSLLNPMLTLVVYTVVFRVIMRVHIPNFPLFLLAGLLPWTFFQLSSVQAANSLIANASLMKKVYFAREVIPISVVLTNLVNFAMTFIVLFIALIVTRVGFGWSLCLLPVLVLLQLLFVSGFALLVSVVTARFRDVAHLLEVVLNAWMYATPVVYPLLMVPASLRPAISANPLTGFVELYRDVTLYHTWPGVTLFSTSAIWAIVMFFVGLVVFRRYQQSVMDRI